jgi:hypothetical protein
MSGATFCSKALAWFMFPQVKLDIDGNYLAKISQIK